MTAVLTAGYRSVNLTVQQPLEDDGITPRTDFVGMKAWGSNTTGFTPGPSNLLFDGRGLSWTLEKLAPGVPVYIRYALISEIEPENYIVSSELAAIPTDIPNSISVEDGRIQGIGGIGDGSFVDNSFIDRGVKWSANSEYIYAAGRTIKATASFPSGGTESATAFATVGQCFTFKARHTAGYWEASISFFLYPLSISMGVDSVGFYAKRSGLPIFRPANSEALIADSDGFFRIEAYLGRYSVYSDSGHAPLVTFTHNPFYDDSEDSLAGQLVSVTLSSQDARVDGIQITPQRDKVYEGSIQPGAVTAAALKPVSLSSIGALTPTTGGAPYYTAPGGPAGLYTTSSWFRVSWAPLADAAAARTLLGLAAIATSGSASNLITGTIPDDRLPPRLRAQGTSVSSADLAIETGGPYYVDAVAPGNPFSEAAIIMVESKGAGRITQRISRYLSDTPSDTGLMWRNYNFGVWSAWEPCPQTKSEQALLWSPVEHTEHSGLLRYSASLRGAVTQITSHTTPVTLNALQGSIKMAVGDIPAGGSVEFQFNNSYITESAMPIVIRRGTSFTSVTASVLRFAVGYCIVRVTNTGASAATGVDPAMSFVILGCATS